MLKVYIHIKLCTIKFERSEFYCRRRVKYLLAGFTIYVLEEPAHPIGTPFPGGQIVDEWEGEYLCPVRDRADGIPFALCPFCPAIQSDEPTYPGMRAVRKERRRKESLHNYRTNYKG